MEENKNKIGIICEPYKTEKFKEELTKAGFTDLEVKPHGAVTIIKVTTPKENQAKVNAICQIVQAHFNQSN